MAGSMKDAFSAAFAKGDDAPAAATSAPAVRQPATEARSTQPTRQANPPQRSAPAGAPRRHGASPEVISQLEHLIAVADQHEIAGSLETPVSELTVNPNAPGFGSKEPSGLDWHTSEGGIVRSGMPARKPESWRDKLRGRDV